MRHQRILWSRTDIQEKRAVIREHALHLAGPLPAPVEKISTRRGVVVAAVVDAEVVGRRGDDRVNGARLQGRQDFQAVAVEKVHEGSRRVAWSLTASWSRRRKLRTSRKMVSRRVRGMIWKTSRKAKSPLHGTKTLPALT